MAGASEFVLLRNGSEEEEIGGNISSARRSSASNLSPGRVIRFHPANIFIPIFSPPIPPSFTFRRPELWISSDSESDSSSVCVEDHVSSEIAPLDLLPSHCNGRGEISSNGDSDLPPFDDSVSGFLPLESGRGVRIMIGDENSGDEDDPLFACRRSAGGDDKLSTSQNFEGSGMGGSRSSLNVDSDEEAEVICLIRQHFDDLLEPDQVIEDLALPDGWDYIGSSIGEDQRDPGEDLGREIERELLDLGEDEAHYNLEWEVLLSADEFDVEFPDELEIYDSPDFEDHKCFIDAIKHLSSISLTEIDVAENKNLCAICKAEISVGEKVKQLPCLHHYHSGCILPWLRIKNTCPLCRFELLEEEPDLREPFPMVTSAVD